LRYKTHATIKKVSEDIEGRFNFNTAISAIMELTNTLSSYSDQEEQDLPVVKEAIDTLLVLLSPFSPHICEELWHISGHTGSICQEKWPQYKADALIQDEIEIVIQISGKVKERIKVPANSSDDDLRQYSLNNAKIVELTKDKKIVKIVIVSGKLVNIVTK
jgi:leucyl-tRNA synthetase